MPYSGRDDLFFLVLPYHDVDDEQYAVTFPSVVCSSRVSSAFLFLSRCACRSMVDANTSARIPRYGSALQRTNPIPR